MAVLTRDLAETRGDDLALADEVSIRTWAELDQRDSRCQRRRRADRAKRERHALFPQWVGPGVQLPQRTGQDRGCHLEPGVFTTGDVGYLDDDGYLWLSDRKIDMIISGGVNIYPAEIEGVLGDHPLIADVTVIGGPNEEFGEEVKAVVVLNDAGRSSDESWSGADDSDSRSVEEHLRAHCREMLAGYKVPRTIDVVDELPRTGTGKVQKRKVRERYWAGQERQI